MPKPRIVDMRFWDDPDIAKLTREERLLVVGMMTACADDEGLLMGHDAYLKKSVFGYDDDITVEDVGQWRDHIFETCRNIIPYLEDGQIYIWFRKWQCYQKIRYVVDSKLPKPTEESIAAAVSAGFCGNSRENAGNLRRVGLGSVEKGRVGTSPEDGDDANSLPPLGSEYSHPAVKDYIRVTSELPNKTQRKMIESGIGYEDAGEGQAWEQTVERWVGHGWRADNVRGMVDKHLKGWGDMDHGRDKPPPSSEPVLEAW